MKKVLFVSLIACMFLATGCSMGQGQDGKNPVEEMIPTHSANPQEDKTPNGGTPQVTEPANNAMDTTISEKDAKKKVLDKIPGASEMDIREWKLEREDGKLVYEGKVVFEQKEYEFELDAMKGDFLKWETESVTD